MGAFYLSKLGFLFCAHGISSLFIALSAYFAAGCHPGSPTFGNVVMFLSAVLLMVFWGCTAGLSLGVLVDRPENSTLMLTPVILINVLFSGFMITSNNIPMLFKVLFFYFSQFHYVFSAMMVTVWKDFEFSGCNGSDTDTDETCPFGDDGTGQDVLDSYHIEFDTYTTNVVFAAVFLCFLFFGGFALLYSQLSISLIVRETKEHKIAMDAKWSSKLMCGEEMASTREPKKPVRFIFKMEEENESNQDPLTSEKTKLWRAQSANGTSSVQVAANAAGA